MFLKGCFIRFITPILLAVVLQCQQMQSFLISSLSKQKREEKALKIASSHSSIVDTYTFSALENGGIELVREASQKLLLLPISSELTTLLITDAHYLTIHAQNALLKLLEEPPLHSQIILTVNNHYSLLPTVISRCLCTNLEGDDPGESPYTQLTESVRESSFSKNTKDIENFEIGEWVKALRSSLRSSINLADKPNSKIYSSLINRAFVSLRLSKVNINKKLLKVNLFLD